MDKNTSIPLSVIQASLGGFDQVLPYESPYDYHLFTDENFPPRKALTTRMQAKIPKLFAYELRPGYEYYVWVDGNIQLQGGAIEFLLEEIGDSEMLFFRHPTRPNIRQEVRYLRKGLREQSIYLVSRYDGDLHKEFYDIIRKDKQYEDDLLVNGGIFIYKDTPKVRAVMKEWWYYITRYLIQDQIPLPYVLKKSGVKYKALDYNIYQSPYFIINRHKHHDR